MKSSRYLTTVGAAVASLVAANLAEAYVVPAPVDAKTQTVSAPELPAVVPAASHLAAKTFDHESHYSHSSHESHSSHYSSSY